MQSTGYDGDVQNGKYFLLSTRNFAKFVMAHALTFHRTYGICLYAYILQALSVRRYLHGNFERAAQRVLALLCRRCIRLLIPTENKSRLGQMERHELESVPCILISRRWPRLGNTIGGRREGDGVTQINNFLL